MEYTNSDLTKSIDAKGYDYKYTYDTKHNMTQAKSQTGVTYNYKYDGKGLATALEVKGSNTKSLKSEAEYSDNGFLKKSIDQDSNSTYYFYNDAKGLLTSYTDYNGYTYYSYDSNTDQLTAVRKTDQYYGGTYRVDYAYSNDGKYLKTISRNGSNYTLEYDQYGNKTNSKVGTQSLASYTYNSNNGAMTSSTYGNGQTVSYAYDAFGNISSKKYNGTTAFAWTADRSGNVVREKDYINKVQYDSIYDTTGRLVRTTAKNTTTAVSGNKSWYTIEYGYDLNNNITRLANITPYSTTTSKYTYGKDNLLTKFDIYSNRSDTRIKTSVASTMYDVTRVNVDTLTQWMLTHGMRCVKL